MRDESDDDDLTKDRLPGCAELTHQHTPPPCTPWLAGGRRVLNLGCPKSHNISSFDPHSEPSYAYERHTLCAIKWTVIRIELNYNIALVYGAFWDHKGDQCYSFWGDERLGKKGDYCLKSTEEPDTTNVGSRVDGQLQNIQQLIRKAEIHFPIGIEETWEIIYKCKLIELFFRFSI